MTTEYNILRGKMVDYLKRRKEGQFNLHGEIIPYFRSEGIELDQQDLCLVEQIFHEFYLEGILVPGVRPKVGMTYQSGTLIFPHFYATPYGEQVLKTTDYQPYDPDGYLAKIKTEISGLDEVIVRYLEECLACFKRNLLFAAAVMLGCAAEKAVLLLVEAFANSLTDPDEKERYEKETKSFIISRKWKALWQRDALPLSYTRKNHC